MSGLLENQPAVPHPPRLGREISWAVRFRGRALVLGMSCLALLPSLHASDKPVDPGLLEFLGSVDTDDKDWHDYLARTDIDQVAKRAGNARGSPPVSSPPKSPPANPPAPASPQPVDHP
jgi:hypothetical protein